MKHTISKMLALSLSIIMIFTLGACNSETSKPNNIEIGKARVLEGTEKQERIDFIETELNKLRSTGTLLQLQYSSSDYAMYMYGSNKEAMVQYEIPNSVGQTESILQVFMKNGGVATFETDLVSYSKDVDILTLIERANYLAEIGVGVMTEIHPSEDVTRVRIDIRGYDNIKSLYDFVDESLAYDVVESLRSDIATQHSVDDTVDVDHVNVRIELGFINEETNSPEEGSYLSLLAGASYLTYTGTKDPVDMDSSDMMVTWTFNGYHILGDWQLESAWYNFDWNNLGEIEDVSPIESMIDTDYNKVNDLMTELYENHLAADDVDTDSDSNTN